MKIAIPTANGQLCTHFGHCQKFALINIDPGTRKITSTEEAIPPPHEPGVLPRWLKEAGVSTIICGGMGQKAQIFFQQFGIDVVVGVSPDSYEKIVEDYMDGTLVTGENVCDH